MEVDSKSSDDDFNSLSIKCSWSELKNEVKDAFTIVQFNNGEDEVDACETIVPESCVFLSQPMNCDESLTIDLSSRNNELNFRKIHIISEANLVEVYGLFGEYIKTVIGELIEEVDGTMAFSCLLENIKLSQVTLKFVGLKGAKEMWFFGGRIWYERNENVPTISKLNMERINSRLSEGNCQLSPSADSLKKLVSEYVNRGSQSKSCFESVAKNFANMQQKSAQQPSSSRSFPNPTQTFEFWQSYIDSSMKHMEKRIMDNVTEQIRELELRQNKRLDHILKLLESNASVPANNNQ